MAQLETGKYILKVDANSETFEDKLREGVKVALTLTLINVNHKNALDVTLVLLTKLKAIIRFWLSWIQSNRVVWC